MERIGQIPGTVIEKAAAGDRLACADIYDRTSSWLFGICLRMLGNRQDAQDILQDSFVLIFKHLPALRNRSSALSWMKTIVVRECIRFAKNKWIWEEQEISETYKEDTGEWFWNIPPQSIEQEIRKLAPGYRVIFTLFVFEEYSHRQIAEFLDISESTSKTQYHRAKKILREQLEKNYRIG